DSRVVFNIAEGPVVKVHRIGFTGNSFVSDARLRTQIDSSRPFLGLIGGVFNPLLADHDALKLEEYYKGHGFQDVKVSRELVYDENYRTVDLVFHIHEGVRYRIGTVQIEGTPHYDRNELASVTKLKTGAFFSKAVVEGDAKNMTDYIGWRGQLAGVQPELT